MKVDVGRSAHARDDVHAELTERQLVERAVVALVEIENRLRKQQRDLRLEIIERVLEFGRQFPDDDAAKGNAQADLH
jgi:hypothetical protein